MNLEEARKVIWMRNNPRPMGELLDEGILKQHDLEWAAKNAFSDRHKEAAKILLAAKFFKAVLVKPAIAENPLKLNMSLEQARTTPWPFTQNKDQPMGELLDAKKLTLKDLGFAIETAWSAKVRQAAITLSLMQLEQALQEPVPSAGFVRVFSGGRSYAEKQQIRLTFLQGAILGIAFGIGIVLTLSYFFQARPNAKSIDTIISSPTAILVLVIVAAIFIFLGWLLVLIPTRISDRLDKEIDKHRLGQEGEERVLQLMIQALDGQWSIFRNVVLPNGKADLDIVLVGPSGVWALEVKNFRGKYRNHGERWETQRGTQWKQAFKSPSQQARKNAARLGNFLKADGLDVFVTPVVVWANEEEPALTENPSVSVWQYSCLPDELSSIWQNKKLPEPVLTKINTKLSKLV